MGLSLFSLMSSAQKHPFQINAGNVVAGVTGDGIVSLRAVKQNKFQYPVKIFTSLEGCETEGEPVEKPLPDEGIEFVRLLKNNTTNSSCTLIERFNPGKGYIHYEIEIKGTGAP